MADTDARKKDTASTAGNIAQAIGSTVVDNITKFWEGVAQVLHDRKLTDLVVMFIFGGLGVRMFMNKLEQLVKQDAGARFVARQKARVEFLALCKEIGDDYLRRVGSKAKEAFAYFRSINLMSDEEFTALLGRINGEINDARTARKKSQQTRKWFVWGTIIALVELLIWNWAIDEGLGIFILCALVHLLVAAVLYFQKPSTTPPAEPSVSAAPPTPITGS